MIALYTLLTSLLYLIVYPWARLKAAGGSRIWRNRLGLGFPEERTIWLHASSAGEVRVISYLAAYLLKQIPSVRLHLTAMTPAGLEAADSLLSPKVSKSYLPLDSPWPIRRVLDRLRPNMIVIAETEIWPLLVTEASKRSIDIVQVNGRMSARAFRRYRMVQKSMFNLLGKYHHFFLRTNSDAERFRQFDIPDEMLTVAGDMKFDAPLIERSSGRVAELRNRFGFADSDFIWVAGSTRSGEDQQLLEAFMDMAERNPKLRLALVPRHLDRVKSIRAMISVMKLSYRLYDDKGLSLVDGEKGELPPVLLINRFGLLNDLYLAADIAFVGGTLVDVGGHNPLEPVWAGTPVLVGPFTKNITESVEYVTRSNYGRVCKDISEISQTVEALCSGVSLFARKTEDDVRQSATVIAGEYILKRLNHA